MIPPYSDSPLLHNSFCHWHLYFSISLNFSKKPLAYGTKLNWNLCCLKVKITSYPNELVRKKTSDLCSILIAISLGIISSALLISSSIKMLLQNLVSDLLDKVYKNIPSNISLFCKLYVAPLQFLYLCIYIILSHSRNFVKDWTIFSVVSTSEFWITKFFLSHSNNARLYKYFSYLLSFLFYFLRFPLCL